MKKIIMTMLVLMGMQQTVSAEIRNMDIAATIVGVGGTVWALKLRSEYKAVEAQAAKLKKNKASMRPEEYKTAMSNLHEEYVQLKRRCKQVAYTTGTVVAAYAAYRGYQWRVQVDEAAAQAERDRVADGVYAAAHAVPGVAARAPGAAVGVAPVVAVAPLALAALRAPARPVVAADLAAIRWEEGGEEVFPAGGALMAGLAGDPQVQALVAQFGNIDAMLRDPVAQAQLQGIAADLGAAMVGFVAAAAPIFQAFDAGVEAALAGGVPAARAPGAAAPARGGARAPAALGDRR